ncbi:MAG TPA: hypothetical protein VJS38_14440 [Phenylobacterium sp.]|uniref:hypothetical protein n=1 Tax=Phenylobacterium sp. TaxID=1871053 RepID=UPI002B499F74|nr:hypothetical protein [Phenylobacterium sp.]HKR89366.1 hypothetical protein [Phenylobacterium sp.]
MAGADITAAYFRRPGVPELDAAVLASDERAYCAVEWSALLKSLYQRIGRRWLSAPAAIAAAEDKPRQLLEAKRLGFAIADTVVTNDVVVFDAFLEGAGVVAKPLRQARLEGATDRVMFTSRVEAAVARDARAIAAAPMILQREVLKAADIRVTVVGDEVFAAEIDSQALASVLHPRRRAAHPGHEGLTARDVSQYPAAPATRSHTASTHGGHCQRLLPGSALTHELRDGSLGSRNCPSEIARLDWTRFARCEE